jgi:acetyltransferase-like isoleucine patch superfamily enzyme
MKQKKDTSSYSVRFPTEYPVPESLQITLTDPSVSALERYRQTVIGQRSVPALLRYELTISLFSGLPGALGLIIRKLFYPKLIKSCGKGVIWGRNVVIRHGHKIHIGDGVVIDDSVVLDAKGVQNSGITIEDGVLISRNSVLSCKDGNIHIGKEVSFGINCLVHAVRGSDVAVGSKTVIASFVYLIGGGNYRLDRTDIPIKDQGTYARGGIHVAEDVWIGAMAKILDGVTVHSGSVVAAGAVVNRNVPVCSVVAGVPAKVIRYR